MSDRIILYGTTAAGGAYDHGTVFQVNPSTGAETVIYSFTGGSDGDAPMAALTAIGGVLYGATSLGGSYGYGAVFQLNASTGAETVLHSFQGGADGGKPLTALLNVNGTLYGTTDGDDLTHFGTIFSVTP